MMASGGDVMAALDDKAAIHREIVDVTEQLRDALPLLLTNPVSRMTHGDRYQP